MLPASRNSIKYTSKSFSLRKAEGIESLRSTARSSSAFNSSEPDGHSSYDSCLGMVSYPTAQSNAASSRVVNLALLARSW